MATPLPLTEPVPRITPPSLKVTVPLLGVPLVLVTVAVKVTAWAGYDGFGTDVTAVLVEAWPLTVWP